MKGHRPVFWNQGLFLQPQHFQAADEAVRQQIEIVRQYGHPYFWGFQDLKFLGTPSMGSVSIESLEAIFPSGAALNVPYDASLTPLALDETWPSPDRPGLLYLGLALPKAGGANAALEKDGEFSGTRYVYSEDPEALPDQYSNAAPARVQFLKYAPILIRDIDKENYTNFECLPIAQLVRNGDHVEFDPRFIPPLLSLNVSQRFKVMMGELFNLALSCVSRLAGYKGRVISGTPDMNFMLNFSALMTLNRYIPRIKHLQSYENTHPWHVYGVLRSFVGELSTYFEEIDCLGRSDNDIEGLPDYDHQNPRVCFEAACELLSNLIGKLGTDRSKMLNLLASGPYFSADIPEDFISPAGRYWLYIQAGKLSDTLADEIPKITKLGMRDRLNVIIAKAVSGVTLSKVPSPPPGFLRSPNSAWYSIDSAHPLWNEIIEKRRVSLFWENAPENTDVRLVATGW